MAKLVELIVGKYDGSLKAEHGTGINMAPLRRARVGGEGDRADVAGEAARRPRRRARPGRRPQPRPRRPPAQPENDAGDRGVGDDLRRVRLLRAGLPEPQPDDDAAPADRRCAARWPASRRARRCSDALLEEYEYDALETCAADGSCQLACPVGIDTGKLVKELRDELQHARARRAARRWRAAEALGRRSRAPRGPRPARRRAAGAAHRGAAAALPGPAPREAAADRARGRGRRLRPLLHQPDLRRGSPGSQALVEVSAPRRAAGLDPRRRRPAAAAACPGARRASPTPHRHKANEMVERLWRWSGEGALPVVDRRRLLHAGGRDPGEGVLDEENVERLALRSSTRSPGRTTACCPGSRSRERVGSATVHPTCATRHLGLAGRAARPRRRRSPRSVYVAALAPPAAASPATAASPTPS